MPAAVPRKRPAAHGGRRSAAPVRKRPAAARSRPLVVRTLGEVGGVPAKVRDAFRGARFFVRATVADDRKGSRHGDEYVLKKMFQERPYEAARRRARGLGGGEDLRGWLRGRTVLDLGANIGSFAVQSAWSGARCVAVEPDAETFDLLVRNAQANAEAGGYAASCPKSARRLPRSGSGAAGSLACLKGAVAHAPGGGQFFLYPKLGRDRERGARGAGGGWRPNKPNRSSLIAGDGVNSGLLPELVQRVRSVWGLPELLRLAGEGGPVSVVKMDVEGAELELFRRLAAQDLRRALGSAAAAEELEVLVYYHLDKQPRLRAFHGFLECLERTFQLVHVEWTPMVPEPGGSRAGLPWSNWREVVSAPGNPESRGGFNPELTGRTDIGMAAAKKDVLVYCRGVR